MPSPDDMPRDKRFLDTHEVEALAHELAVRGEPHVLATVDFPVPAGPSIVMITGRVLSVASLGIGRCGRAYESSASIACWRIWRAFSISSTASPVPT